MHIYNVGKSLLIQNGSQMITREWHSKSYDPLALYIQRTHYFFSGEAAKCGKKYVIIIDFQ